VGGPWGGRLVDTGGEGGRLVLSVGGKGGGGAVAGKRGGRQVGEGGRRHEHRLAGLDIVVSGPRINAGAKRGVRRALPKLWGAPDATLGAGVDTRHAHHDIQARKAVLMPPEALAHLPPYSVAGHSAAGGLEPHR